MKLSNIRISGKLYLLILVAFACMAGLAGIGLYQIERVYQSANFANINTVPSYIQFVEIRRLFAALREQSLLHVVANDQAKISAIELEIGAVHTQLSGALKAYSSTACFGASCVVDEKEQKLLDDVVARLAEYDVQRLKVFEHARRNRDKEAEVASRDLVLPAVKKLNDAFDVLLAYNVQLAEKESDDAAAAKSASTMLLGVVALLEFVLLGFVAWLIANRGLVRPMNAVVDDLQRLADGKLEVTVSGLVRRDEIGDIARAAQVFKEFAQTLDTQRWVKSQVAELSGAMQSAETPDDFSNAVIGKIAPLLESGAAAFYMLQHASGRFELTGSWGRFDRKNLATSFRLGEGLVGQCARDKTAILLSDVPGDYLRISSGLGDAAPRVILLTPIIVKDTVIGVIEIAAFKWFSDVQRALVDELMPVVALNLEIIERNMRTRELLRETQEQAQKLQASEEELRMQSEELAASNEELRSSEEELRTQSDIQKAINEELTAKGAALQEAQEISERRAAELEKASRYKSDFLANMSHELRTPLNSLLILAGDLAENAEDNLTADQLESVKIIRDGGQHLLRLINDILDLSKVEAGKMTVVEADVDLSSFAGCIRRNFAALAKSQSLLLTVDVAPDVPPVMRGDAGKMEQIVTNLVGNAFKFTRQGGVTVRLSRLAANGAAGDRLAIAVEDTGIGIPADKQEQIFGAFEQVDGTSSRQYGGTGLGLTISRRLANLLGGDITVSSTEGRGSIFTLILPLHVAAGTVPAAEPLAVPETATSFADDRATIQPGDKTILIVEDDDVFARIECDLARKRGFKCLRAADGKTALQLAERYRPAGILLDIGLPGLDGWAVMDALKKKTATRNIPVRIISGQDEGERSLAMGAVGHLQKPVDKIQLNAVFDRLSLLTGDNVRRVLIVDDDELSRKVVGAVVEGKQIELVEASDGGAALEMLESGRFDCMILDLDLPDFSGFELLERASQRWGALPPVVVYTGRNLSFEENLALREYTDSIVVKGARAPERLADEVSLFLHGVHSSLPGMHRQTPAPASGKVEALAGKTVLVVDDDMRNAFALSKVLRGKGLNVLLAQDGFKALAQLNENADVDVVLMDIMMPGKDGYETISEIRAQPRFDRLPIIALTAKAMPGDREKCIGVGANEYFSKPVDIERLVEAMCVLVRQG